MPELLVRATQLFFWPADVPADTGPAALDCTTALPARFLNRPVLALIDLGQRAVLATRKPMLLLRLSGVFLLRLAARVFLALLFQEPPRRTRDIGPAERTRVSALRKADTLVRLDDAVAKQKVKGKTVKPKNGDIVTPHTATESSPHENRRRRNGHRASTSCERQRG